MNLETTYLGLNLRTPLVVSASPLSASIDNIRQMEDAGASAIVLHSLFEEQIRVDQQRHHRMTEQGEESNPEALSYFPDPRELRVGPEAYLEHVAHAKAAVNIPIIASLNGTTPGGWLEFAREIERAGADALELNLHTVVTDPHLSSAELERRYLLVLRAVKAEIRIPVAVKLSPFFTNLASMARELDEAGADGLVLFNRFFQPDIELETLEVVPSASLSVPHDMRLPLRWISILFGRVRARLAATGGILKGTDAVKMLLAGADVTMVCSALMQHGIDHLATIEAEMTAWLVAHEYRSVQQIKGSLSHERCPDPTAFERAHYMRAVGVRWAH